MHNHLGMGGAAHAYTAKGVSGYCALRFFHMYVLLLPMWYLTRPLYMGDSGKILNCTGMI